MRREVVEENKRVVAVSGKHAVAFAIEWPEEESEGWYDWERATASDFPDPTFLDGDSID